MKSKKKSMRNYAIFFAVLIFAGVLVLLVNPNATASITEVSCTGDKIWIKYDLADDTARLSNLIEDCRNNPAGGFVGEVYFVATTPQGNDYTIGGYTASKDSIQKISCGTDQDGKEFAGTTIPNEGKGTYTVTVKGKYYLEKEDYAIPHPYSYTVAKSIQCILPSDTCDDGTALRQCSQTYIGKYCTAEAALVDRANKCGCPEGMRVSGYYCKPIAIDDDPTDVPPVEDNPIGFDDPQDIDSPPTSQEQPDVLLFGFPRLYFIVGGIILLMGVSISVYRGWI